MNIVEYSPINARMPVNYEAARKALQECARVDEVLEWRDRAKAIATYAAQKRDRSLFDKAERIKARAVRRLGELIEETREATGETILKIAKRSGISVHEANQGRTVARIKLKVFDDHVENRSPPAPLSALLALGQNHPFGADTSAPAWKAADRLLKLIKEFPADAVRQSAVSCNTDQRAALKKTWIFVSEWFDAVSQVIEK